MHILITGGTGFIGQALCSYLGKTYELTILTRDIKKAKKLFGEQYDYIESLDELARENVMPDAIINLAGESLAARRWTPKQKQLVYNSRIELTRSLYDFVSSSRIKPQVLINGSAIGFYGDRGDTLLDEDDACADDFAATLCKDWEEAANRMSLEKVRVVCLRIGMVLGKGGALQKMLPAFRMGLGGKLGSGEQYVSWIHIKDMVRIICFCLEQKNISGPVNATSPLPVSNKAFTLFLAKSLRRFAVIPVPALILKLLLGEMAGMLLTGQRVIPEKLVKAGFTFNFPSIESALNELHKK